METVCEKKKQSLGYTRSKTKILTTYRIVTKLNTQEDSVDATFHCESQFCQRTLSKELAALR